MYASEPKTRKLLWSYAFPPTRTWSRCCPSRRDAATVRFRFQVISLAASSHHSSLKFMSVSRVRMVASKVLQERSTGEFWVGPYGSDHVRVTYRLRCFRSVRKSFTNLLSCSVPWSPWMYRTRSPWKSILWKKPSKHARIVSADLSGMQKSIVTPLA